jgi:hypothetical protein
VPPHPNRPPAAKTGSAIPARPADAWWVEPAARAALVVFVALIALAVVRPDKAGRVFWTVAVASLPLVFVLAGYHRWRRICPLAWVAQIPSRLGRAGHRRAGPWLQAHGYDVAFGALSAGLWLRLVATNGDGLALAAFLVALAAIAVAVGVRFTGKTWCNYVCPVSFVEKLYTEPRGLRDTPNSQCAACTACKPACPDINEENSYWKEVLSPSKARAYFAFPGMVVAFYTYYFLQAGTWSYYFDGRWTDEAGLFRTAFLPGHDAATAGFFFLPAAPRALAAALTLASGATVSLLAFSAAEPRLGAILRRRGAALDAAALRSTMFTLAAFAAFVAFYSFAGAPTLRLVPGLPHVFQLLVVATATLLLVRRITRRQAAFTEETLARKIIANWKWEDIPAPKDLREAFLIHTVRSQSHEEGRRRLLDLYRQSVRDSLRSGMLSRGEVHRLESLRNQMGITSADHERVMAELADEEGGLAAQNARLLSPEKQLQLDTYAEALAVHLERNRAAGRPTDDAFVRDLRRQYEVTAEEHGAVLDRLLSRQDGVGAHLADVPATIEWTAETVAALERVKSSVARFLVRLLRRRWARAADALAQALGSDGDATTPTVAGLLSPDAPIRASAVAAIGARLSEAAGARLSGSLAGARDAIGAAPSLPRLLRAQLTSPDPYVRATSLYLLESMDEATDADRAPLEDDEHPVVRETAMRRPGGTILARGATATTLEKMVGLAPISLFEDLEPEELAELARAGTERWFRQDEAICRAGEAGDEAFVVLDGEVSVLHPDGSVAYVEGAGSCIGELAVLDPAPREATVVASTVAVRALSLTGTSLRNALDGSPAMSDGIIRILARRLRRAIPASASVTASRTEEKIP